MVVVQSHLNMNPLRPQNLFLLGSLIKFLTELDPDLPLLLFRLATSDKLNIVYIVKAHY